MLSSQFRFSYQTRKLESPFYECSEEGRPEGKRFTCTAKCANLTATGEKCKTKKDAKNSAAKALFELISQSLMSVGIDKQGE